MSLCLCVSVSYNQPDCVWLSVSVSLSFCVSVCVFLCVYVCLSLCFLLTVPFTDTSVCFSSYSAVHTYLIVFVCPSVYLFVSGHQGMSLESWTISVSLLVPVSVCLSICVSVSLCVYLFFFFLPVSLSVCLSFWCLSVHFSSYSNIHMRLCMSVCLLPSAFLQSVCVSVGASSDTTCLYLSVYVFLHWYSHTPS